MVTISPQGKITDVNRATEEATGVPRAGIVGTDFADYVTEPERARAVYGRVLASGQVHDYPLTIRHVDGRTTEVLYNATIYRRPDGVLQGVFAAARDITEQRRLEDQLRQSQKLEAIGRLAGGVAHDFNNLLTAITSASDFLLGELPPAEAAHQDAADIQEAARRASALTLQLLTFSRKQVVQPKVLDLNEVVVRMDRMLRRLLGENIELVALPAPELGRVRVDPGQMEQVIVNLAVNARDAMPTGGKITIQTANVEVGREEAWLPDGMLPGRFVTLTVLDTGHGMGPDTLSHLFEPFFTTKGPGKGTGLGLSTVYGIVKQAEGAVLVHSEPGKGSAFEVYLPRVDASPDTLAAEAGPPPRGTETVLLVEDDPLVRKLTARSLRDAGYQVLEAADGEEAWGLAAGRVGELDLVITDLVMPRMGGKDLADRLRKERPGVGILLVSGYTEHAADLQALFAEGCQFLQKPFAPTTLARRVRELLDRRRVNRQ
jgi:PAS domain S-box-containing protein